ncbi:MAG: HEAT repeat domain-containing protein [Planctomycetota bacterium]|nr:HEAT repeat domain-containing protein [Planctomycetota bacterium]
MEGKVNYDEVALELSKQLLGTPQQALDAAYKLGSLGKRAVPLCSDLLQRSEDEQVRYYCVLALSRMRDKGAAQALLPLVADEKADAAQRELAINAVSGESLEEGVPALSKVAKSEANGVLRFKALLALSIMPTAWATSEELYVKALADARDDVRQLAAKVCHQVATVKIYYRSGEPALLELSEKDPVIPVRCNAIAALARMKSQLAVPVWIRLLGDPQTPEPVAQQALKGLTLSTGVPLRDAKAAQTWWEKYGQERYKNPKALLLDADVLKLMEAEAAERKAKEEEAARAAQGNPPRTEPQPGSRDPQPVPADPQPGARDPKKLPVLPDDQPEDKPFKGAVMGE